MNKSLRLFTKATDKFVDAINVISMIDVVFLMIMIVIDIITGNFLSNPIPGVYEVLQVFLSVLVFTSWCYAQSKHSHIHVTLFIMRFPTKLRFVCFGITSFISTIAMAIGTYAVFLSMLSKKASGECTGTLQIPYWPFDLIEFLSFAVFTLLLCRDSIRALVSIKDKEMAAEIQATW